MSEGKDLYKVSLQKLNAYLDANKKRHTLEREEILKDICRLQVPFTPAQLQEGLSFPVSRATIYNTLRLLINADVLTCHRKGSNTNIVLYELSTANANQLLLICSRCGRVSRLHDTMIKNILTEKRYTNFNMQRFSIYVYGECKKCKKKK